MDGLCEVEWKLDKLDIKSKIENILHFTTSLDIGI